VNDPMATIVAPPGAGTTSDAELARSLVASAAVDQALRQVVAGKAADCAAALLAAGVIDQAQAATLRRLPPARLVGPFELVGRLGAGAMGEVHRARDLERGGEAALKLVTGRFEDDPGFQRRFEREAKVLEGLDHPAIARCLGRGTHQGHPWMAMEYVRGPSLADLLASHGPMLQQHAVRLCLQVAQGLHHAWEHGNLVHRDIKPGNILVERGSRDHYAAPDHNDRAKIIDFGLAKAAETGSASTVLTMAGTVLGTPAYMSPEQVTGNETDCRSDVYALGATLYHLLTGAVPYEGRSPAEVMSKHLHEPIQDPGRMVPALAQGIRRLAMTAMAKDPGQRFRDHQAFAIAAQECLDEMRSRRLPLVRKPLTTKYKTPLPVAAPQAPVVPTTARHRKPEPPKPEPPKPDTQRHASEQRPASSTSGALAAAYTDRIRRKHTTEPAAAGTARQTPPRPAPAATGTARQTPPRPAPAATGTARQTPPRPAPATPGTARQTAPAAAPVPPPAPAGDPPPGAVDRLVRWAPLLVMALAAGLVVLGLLVRR
jgi:serine/threonine protein kinase